MDKYEEIEEVIQDALVSMKRYVDIFDKEQCILFLLGYLESYRNSLEHKRSG